MTLTEAARAGIERVRLPEWAPLTYVKLDILDGGRCGPWAHLYAQYGVTAPKVPTDYPLFKDSGDRYEPYTGPLLEAPK